MKHSKLLFLCAVLAFSGAKAQVTPTVQMEPLTRGVMAMPAQESGMYVSWRMLGTDDAKTTTFNLVRDGKLIARNICGRTNFTDPNGSARSSYQVVTLVNGQEVATSEAVTPWTNQYKVLQMNRPADGIDDVTGETYSYTPNDCSTGDVDGDGEYEIIVKWQPSNSTTNNGGGYHPGIEYIDCYRLSGEMLWRIDMGINMIAGDHHTQYLVYDFDMDGKSEIIMRTGPGGKDGQGNYVNQVADDPEIKAASNTTDWRAPNGARMVGGQEYLTVFEGATGKAIHTIFYNPNRDGGYGGEAPGTKLNWDDRSGKKDYVASYGNRGNRFLAAVAYLDGADKRPSAVMCRGYYTYSYLWAVDFDGAKLKHRWLHGSVSKTKVEVTDANMNKTSRTYNSNTFGTSDVYTAYGQGNHNLSVADVDADGCDEIIYGSATIDNDGWLLYSTGLGHGDAMHVADMIISRPGYEVFRCNESSPYGIAMYDARTGETIFHQTADGDTGRGLAADISDQYEGYEFWGPKGNNPRETASGEFNTIISSAPSMNFRIYWDGDLQDELFDGSLNSNTGIASPNITDWDGSKYVKKAMGYNNSQTCNWTKATPCLQADILGDWREELIMWNLNDPSQLNIIATNIESQHRVPTLMHDHNYRLAIAWQNVGYNQPPHLGYYLAGTNFNIEGEEEFLEEVKPEETPDDEPSDENVLLAYTFEKGEASDYWKRGNGSIVQPVFDGSTGNAASIVSGSDRADFFLTPADFTGVDSYALDLDLAIVEDKKTAYFTVMSQSAPDEVANNWGWFWVTTEAEVHNPYLFELTIPAGTTATVNESIIEGQSERGNQGTWTFTSSHWYHLTLNVDVTKATVNYQITDKSNETIVLTGTYKLRTGESPLVKGIYERNNRNGYDPGAILIDNVTITRAEKKYQLTYMVDGKVYQTETLAPETTIVAPKAPVKEGHTFSGWSEVPATMPAQDVTVTGTFTANTYTVTYVLDGNTFKTEQVTYGKTITLPEVPDKEGHTFNGWGETPATMPAKNLTFTGSYTLNTYMVIYQIDGVEHKRIEAKYGETITVIEAPVKEGHTFSGWSEVPATMPAQDVTVTGTFTVNIYKLTYTVDGEEYATDSIAYSDTIAILEAPVKEGYTFSGWSEAPATMPAHDVTVTGSFKVTGIEEVITEDLVDVYTLQGVKIKHQISAKDLAKILPRGIYIVGGKKVVVR